MAGQRDIIEFLSRPETHGGKPVVRIDTHISHIFLAGEDAYKLKRAVKLSFLDFSTPGRRHDACQNEIRVNRRTAPDIYLGVKKISKTKTGYSLNGDGKAIDWVVHMARFPDDALLSHLAQSNQLTPALIDQLADSISDFHKKCERRADQGGKQAVHELIEQVSSVFTGGQTWIPAADFRAWQKALNRQFSAAGARFESRRRHGYVRHCHGDLHLANICLWRGSPTPFDAIEFNDSLACIDTLYDIAFPVMDLFRYGFPDYANQLINRYLEAVRDYSGLKLFPIFLSLRAAVRSMVHMIAFQNGQRDPATENLIKAFFSASTELLQRPAPKLIAVSGLSGSGKSTLARKLAPEIGGPIGAIHIRSDGIRKRLFGLKPEVRLPPDAYQGNVSATVYRQLGQDAFRALQAGATVIADATFLRPGDKRKLEIIARRAGVSFKGLWLEAPADALKARIKQREKGASDADISILERQLAKGYGVDNWQTLCTAPPLETTLEHAKNAINRP